jgi:hypothetical protein
MSSAVISSCVPVFVFLDDSGKLNISFACERPRAQWSSFEKMFVKYFEKHYDARFFVALEKMIVVSNTAIKHYENEEHKRSVCAVAARELMVVVGDLYPFPIGPEDIRKWVAVHPDQLAEYTKNKHCMIVCQRN